MKFKSSLIKKMIETESILSGYTVAVGSWTLHLGMFIGSLINFIAYPSDKMVYIQQPWLKTEDW